MTRDLRLVPLEPEAEQENTHDLGTTLTIYQLLMLFQAARMPDLQGSFEAVTTSHSLAISVRHHLNETSCSEVDWLERAQARALERLGLVKPNHDNTRWTLTRKGDEAMRWYRLVVTTHMPPE